ncbi:CoA transferase [Actinopolymorpha pittospori]
MTGPDKPSLSAQQPEEVHPLDDLRVADLSDSVAGQFATRLLADHGATVVLVEPPTGSALRRLPPFGREPENAAPESLLFRHLNTGKVTTCLGEDRLAALRRQADTTGHAYQVLVVSNHATASRAAGMFPDACVAAVTDFPETGPYAHWTGSELIHQALSGSMYYNGRSDARPLYGIGHRAYYAAGLHLYIRIVSERIARLQGKPSHDRLYVSVHEAAASMEQNFSTQWAYSSTIAGRGEWNRPKGRVRCRDGWMAFFASNRTRRELFHALGAAHAADDPRFTDWLAFVRNIADACALFNAGAAALTQQEILAAAIRDKLILSPMRRLDELFSEDHLVARGYWRTGPGSRTALGPMWRLDGNRIHEAPSEAVLPPHTCGAPKATRDVEPSQAGWSTDHGYLGPLSGLRVADFTSAWSGPMATRILAALGAEVVKVEGPQRMDGWRGDRMRPFHLESYPDCQPGVRPYNRNAWFNTQNAGKKSIAIDLKQEEGVTLALDLIAVSDLVIANFSPGTMQRIGLGFNTLRSVNPEIVLAEMSAFGDSGPLREHRGLGQTMEAMSGISYLIGYAED